METSEAEKRTDAKRFKLLAEPKGGCLSAGLWERSAPGFSFLDGIFGREPAGNLPHKGRVGSRTAQIRREALHTDTHTHTHTHTHWHTHARERTRGSIELVGTREEGAQGRDPGLC